MTKTTHAFQRSGCLYPLLSSWDPDCIQAMWPPGEVGRRYGTWVIHPMVWACDLSLLETGVDDKVDVSQSISIIFDGSWVCRGSCV